jgi:hypothetical protein
VGKTVTREGGDSPQDFTRERVGSPEKVVATGSRVKVSAASFRETRGSSLFVFLGLDQGQQELLVGRICRAIPMRR